MSEKEQDLPEEDLAELERAYQLLEYPSFAARLSSLIGDPIEQALHLMPKSWYRKIDEAAERSISGMLDLTINGMTQISPDASNDPLHRVLVMGTGAVGGFFGPALLLAELPVTTALMLRSRQCWSITCRGIRWTGTKSESVYLRSCRSVPPASSAVTLHGRN